MKILFFLVHPAKFHFHKVQINILKEKGHLVDVFIVKKDILEDLVIEEGWKYKNIFPEGRKLKGIHVYLAAGINLLRTIYRLWKYTKGRKYDLFIGDALTYLGRIKRVPSLYPTDDVLSAVPEQATWFIPTNYIIAPNITDIGKYKHKKIAYDGYKAIAHLHPAYFKPDMSKLSRDLQNGKTFFLIRCVKFGATHDVKKSGISNEVLFKLVKDLSAYGKILITSERDLPPELEEHRLVIKKNDITHYLAFANLFIGDSTTMCTEAAVLGTPAVEFDEYFYEIEQMIELEKKFGLIFCFRTNQQKEFFSKIIEIITTPDYKKNFLKKRDALLSEKINVSDFLIWLYENYPRSIKEYFQNSKIQYRFK